MVTRIVRTPIWVFFRLAILVTLFLWLPDLYILYNGQRHPEAVAILMLMHLAIALVTYNALSGWLPLDHQHDGLSTQRLELRAPEVCADSARSAQVNTPAWGGNAQERFHAGDHEERDQNSAAYERCELR